MNDNDIIFFESRFEDDAISALDTFDLKLTGLYIAFPEAKTQYVELPFSNEVIDLTAIDGVTYYKQREIELTFDFVGDFSRWHMCMSRIAGKLHGQKIKVVDTTDAAFFYIGRLALDTTKSDPVIGTVTITGLMNPFKYELQSSAEEWLWDPFDLETGIIREYKDLKVDGMLSVEIEGTAMTVVPVITISTDMDVVMNDKTYHLKKGSNKISTLKIKEGNNVLVFKGNGTVTIDYRGGWL